MADDAYTLWLILSLGSTVLMSWLKSGIVCSLLALPALAATGGWQSLGNVSAVEALPQGAELRAGAARVRVLAQSPNVVRVRYAPKGSFPPEHSFAVLPNVFSEPPKIQLEQSADDILFNTGALQVKILKAPFRILFLDAKGNVISQDHAGYPVSFNGDAFRVWKSMPEDEHYFGLGDKSGPLDHRNQSFSMWNTDAYGWQESTEPLYKTIPFFLALKNGKSYGIFLDNTWRSNFDFGKESRDTYSFGSDGGELDYYFFYGPHPKQVVENFTALVGRPPLPPLWSLGFQQCRYSYYPEAGVRAIARGLRQ